MIKYKEEDLEFYYSLDRGIFDTLKGYNKKNQLKYYAFKTGGFEQEEKIDYDKEGNMVYLESEYTTLYSHYITIHYGRFFCENDYINDRKKEGVFMTGYVRK